MWKMRRPEGVEVSIGSVAERNAARVEPVVGVHDV